MSLKLNELLVTNTITGSVTGSATNLSSSTNNATLYANTGSYGSWKIGGTRGGWYGIEFESNVSLMANSTEVGFHKNGIGWQMRWSVGTGYIYKGANGGGTEATILDSSNQSYAWNLNQNLRITDSPTFADLFITGQYQIRNASPTITLRDTDHRTGYIHVNSNIFYVLTGPVDSASGGWSVVANSKWPLEINLTNNNAVFGGDVNAITMTSPIYYDANDTNYYGDFASTSRFNELRLLGVGTSNYYLMKYGSTRSGDWQSFTNLEGQINVVQVENISSGAHSNYPAGVYAWGGLMSWRTGNHSFQLYAAHTGDLAYKTQWNNDNYSNWRRILDSSNYPHAANMNQYVRTTDNVTFGTVTAALNGNATTATSADNIDGVSFVNTSSNSGTNADSINSNGISYYTSGVTNFTGNATDGGLYSQAYSSSWQHQIAGDYRSGEIALRGKNNGTWQSWRRVLDSANNIFITGLKYFQSDLGSTSGALNNPPLQVYATGGNSAFMSFHRGGSWAVNMGLDSDNVFRIGGWSASANRLELDMSGNMNIAGSFRTGDGSLSAPSHSFASDTDTGMYRITTNQLGMAAGGVLGFSMTSTAMSTILPYLFVGGMTAWNTTTPGTTKGFLHLGDASSTSNTGVGITWGARDSSAGTTAQAGIYVITDGTYGTKMYFATTNNYTTGAQMAMRIEHTGDVIFSRGSVGIGTSPAYKLDVNGACHASSFPTSSDARFKKNIKPILNSLDKINKLNGVVYEWNEFVHARRDGYELNTPIIGVIAQDLEKVLPEVVSKWNLSEDCTDARAVDYIRIIPVLIEAIKELNNKNSILEARILALENKQ